MNIILGKYQLSIIPFGDNRHLITKNKLVFPRFGKVLGLGRTKINWLLAHVGGARSSRISIFLNKQHLIDREKIILDSFVSNYHSYAGIEFKELRSKQRFRKHRFLISFQSSPIKKKKRPHLNKIRRKKLIT